MNCAKFFRTSISWYICVRLFLTVFISWKYYYISVSSKCHSVTFISLISFMYKGFNVTFFKYCFNLKNTYIITRILRGTLINANLGHSTLIYLALVNVACVLFTNHLKQKSLNKTTCRTPSPNTSQLCPHFQLYDSFLRFSGFLDLLGQEVIKSIFNHF